jgi:alanine racemase
MKIQGLLQWVEIDKAAVTHNLQQFRELIGEKKKLLAMVKANAYGHGMVEISKILVDAGVDWLGVHSLEEGIILREKGFDSPVLIAGYVPLSCLKEAVVHDLRLTVYNPETITRLNDIGSKLKKKIFLHLKVETGTFRQGIAADDVIPFVAKLKKMPWLFLEGISSHFSNIEDTTDHSYARLQHANFTDVLDRLEENNIKVPLKHMSCTAAAILFSDTYFDMVRVGIGIYGLWPSKETYVSSLIKEHQTMLLKPVLSWKARVAQIKKVPKGSYIGYGCTYRTLRDTATAVLPVGYYDGYSRKFSNSSYVLIKGKRAPLLGRVAMDFIVVDITDISGVKLEEEVTLLGNERDDKISADHLASLAGTINYEILTRISPHVPRIVV